MEKTQEVLVDEKVVVEISIDKMFGVILFTEPQGEGKLLSKEKIRAAIQAKEICYGIDETLFEEICTQRKYNYKYFIAKGKFPTAGESAFIEYKFDVESIKKALPALKEDGSVDFKNLNIMYNVKAEEVLAIKHPPQMGEVGYNVFGHEMSAKLGKDKRLPIGKHTKVLSDGITLVAARDGQIEYDDHSITISPTFYVNKDVDSSTGNIDFIGNVVVDGIVHSGFSIKAKGNVEIKGYVEAATIEAEGDIILKHGIQGNEKGFLKAGGNIIAKFIQSSQVSADGDIITEAILHSQVSANGEVLVHKGKGTLVGGTTIAGKRITANIIGSAMNTITTLQIGVSKNLLFSYQENLAYYNKLKEEVNKVNKNIYFLQNKSKEEKLSVAKQDLLKQLIQTQVILSNQLIKAEEGYKEKVDLLRNTNQGMIKVQDRIYPGTRVSVGDLTKYIMQENTRCLIQRRGGEIEIGIL